MFTYVTTTTVPSFPDIQELYSLSISQVNWTVAIPALGLAVGPLIWSSPADIFGRRVIFVVGTIIAFAATIGAAKAPSYGGYMAARFFQGFGVSPAATVGLAIINDLFFDYQRGEKVGYWVLALDMGLLVGPLIGGFMNLVDQFWIHWLTAIIFGVILIAELFFLPETLYPRNHVLPRMPFTDVGGDAVDIESTARRTGAVTDVQLVRTKKLPFINVKPVPGLRHPKPWDSLVRFVFTWKYLTVSISVFVYCFTWYWWILSVITYIPVAYVQYTPQIQGLLFLGLILGTLFGEIFCSGRLSDWLVIRLAKKNGAVCTPEMRLWLAYPAALSSASEFAPFVNRLTLMKDHSRPHNVGSLHRQGASLDGWPGCFLLVYVSPRSPAIVLILMILSSRRGRSDRQHGCRRIHRGLLSPAVHVHDHVLFGTAQPQRVHQPLLHRTMGRLSRLHMDLRCARNHHLLRCRAGSGSGALVWSDSSSEERRSELGQPGI